MPTLIPFLAAAAAVFSAVALYGGSRHCRWTGWRKPGHVGTWLGALLAVVSLALWIVALGAGAGLCGMLGSWMLSMMALPYAAGLRIAPAQAARGDA